MNQHLVFNENIKSFDLNNIFKYVEGKYGVFTLDSIREYLRLSKRIEKCKIDVYFINSCLQNNIMPKFTHFKTTNNRLRTQPIYHTCRKLLTTTELSNHNSDLRILYRQIKQLQLSRIRAS